MAGEQRAVVQPPPDQPFDIWEQARADYQRDIDYSDVDIEEQQDHAKWPEMPDFI